MFDPCCSRTSVPAHRALTSRTAPAARCTAHGGGGVGTGPGGGVTGAGGGGPGSSDTVAGTPDGSAGSAPVGSPAGTSIAALDAATPGCLAVEPGACGRRVGAWRVGAWRVGGDAGCGFGGAAADGGCVRLPPWSLSVITAAAAATAMSIAVVAAATPVAWCCTVLRTWRPYTNGTNGGMARRSYHWWSRMA